MATFLVKTQLTFDEQFALPYWRDQENDLWCLDCEFIELENPKNWQSKVKTTSEKEEMSRRGSAREAGMRCDYPNKIDFTIRCINRALKRVPAEKWCLSWSALSCIFRKYFAHLKVHHVMSNTRLEYPETIRNMHAYKATLKSESIPVTIAYPYKKPMQVWDEDGIPLFSKELTSKYRQCWD